MRHQTKLFGLYALILIFILPLTVMARKDVRKSDYREYRDIHVKASGSDELVGFPLPFALIEAGGMQLKNFYLTDPDGKAVGFAVRSETVHGNQPRSVTLKVIDFDSEEDAWVVTLENRTVSSYKKRNKGVSEEEIFKSFEEGLEEEAKPKTTRPKKKRLRVPKGYVIDRINIKTSMRDFYMNVSVEGSHDEKEWQTLVERTGVYDFSSQVSYRKFYVKLPKSGYEFYRLSFKDLNEDEIKGLDIKGEELVLDYGKLHLKLKAEGEKKFRMARFYGLSPKIKRKKAIDRETFENPAFFQKENKSLLKIENVNVSVSSVEFRIKEKNYLRNVKVSRVSNQPGIAPYQVGKGSIYDFTISKDRDFNRELALTRHTGSVRYPNLEVSIENGDNPPLTVESLTLEWVQRAFLFFPSAGHTQGTYRLYYGSDRDQNKRYDVEKIIQKAYRRRGYTRVQYGEPQSNAQYQQDVTTYLQKHPMILNIFVLVLAAGMGFWLWRLIKMAQEKDAGVNE